MRGRDLPDWVADEALRGSWDRIRARFERAGLVPEGQLELTPATPAERRALATLLGRPSVPGRVRVDLAGLDARLRQRSGVGGLKSVLTSVSDRELLDRPRRRAQLDAAREGPLALARELVQQPWGAEWVAGLRRSGLLTGRPEAEQVVRAAARVLDAVTVPSRGGTAQGVRDGSDRLSSSQVELAARPASSRVELAARLLGDAHALDRDTLLHQVVLRALAAAHGTPLPSSARDRESLWARAGLTPDLVSRTALVWGLRIEGDSPLRRRLDLAAEDADPVHLTDWDLRRSGPLVPAPGRGVLVCENPRVLEAVAQSRLTGWAVVCGSGEPNLVVDRLLLDLAATGVGLRYHGDFDWPGIAIANRVVGRYAAQPWSMSARDYLDGLTSTSPALVGTPVTPSWDQLLGEAMRRHGRGVHEESVLDALLDRLRDFGGRDGPHGPR